MSALRSSTFRNAARARRGTLSSLWTPQGRQEVQPDHRGNRR
jgi:hypothetical protein